MMMKTVFLVIAILGACVLLANATGFEVYEEEEEMITVGKVQFPISSRKLPCIELTAPHQETENATCYFTVLQVSDQFTVTVNGTLYPSAVRYSEKVYLDKKVPVIPIEIEENADLRDNEIDGRSISSPYDAFVLLYTDFDKNVLIPYEIYLEAKELPNKVKVPGYRGTVDRDAFVSKMRPFRISGRQGVFNVSRDEYEKHGLQYGFSNVTENGMLRPGGNSTNVYVIECDKATYEKVVKNYNKTTDSIIYVFLYDNLLDESLQHFADEVESVDPSSYLLAVGNTEHVMQAVGVEIAGKQYVLTAKHLLNMNEDEDTKKVILIGSQRTCAQRYMTFKGEKFDIMVYVPAKHINTETIAFAGRGSEKVTASVYDNDRGIIKLEGMLGTKNRTTEFKYDARVLEIQGLKPGNSGAAIRNLQGKVVGLVSGCATGLIWSGSDCGAAMLSQHIINLIQKESHNYPKFVADECSFESKTLLWRMANFAGWNSWEFKSVNLPIGRKDTDLI